MEQSNRVIRRRKLDCSRRNLRFMAETQAIWQVVRFRHRNTGHTVYSRPMAHFVYGAKFCSWFISITSDSALLPVVDMRKTICQVSTCTVHQLCHHLYRIWHFSRRTYTHSVYLG